jgi:hypothetical protein
MQNWTWLKDLITLKALPASILFLVGLFILIIPDKIAKFLSIETFRKEYRSWIGILTILAGVTLLCRLVRYSFLAFRKLNTKREILKQLSALSREEKLILYSCVRNNSATVLAPQGNCFLQALCSKGLMEKAGGTGTIISWPYIVPTWIWKYLQRQSANIFSEFNNLDQDRLMEEIKTILGRPLNIFG